MTQISKELFLLALCYYYTIRFSASLGNVRAYYKINNND